MLVSRALRLRANCVRPRVVLSLVAGSAIARRCDEVVANGHLNHEQSLEWAIAFRFAARPDRAYG
jgi:hypothetical protein